MIKLTIFNMEEFLRNVNECTGPVNMICPDGRRQNISRQYELQYELRNKHRENRRCLELALEIPNPKDYMKLIFFTIGDC